MDVCSLWSTCRESDVVGAGWELKGELTRGRSRPIGDHDLGVMWECPFFVPLQPHTAGGAGAASSQGQQDQYVLCVSPYPHHLKDRPTNTCLYWTGAMDAEGHFSLEQASGTSCRPPPPPTPPIAPSLSLCLSSMHMTLYD